MRLLSAVFFPPRMSSVLLAVAVLPSGDVMIMY